MFLIALDKYTPFRHVPWLGPVAGRLLIRGASRSKQNITKLLNRVENEGLGRPQCSIRETLTDYSPLTPVNSLVNGGMGVERSWVDR